MNDTPRDPWEGEMSDEFDRRVRDLHEAPLDLSSVKGKAMHIRRKRRAAVAGGILAAAAVIVPIAVLAGSGNDRADTIDPAPSVTISDTPTVEPSEEPTAVDTDNPTDAPTLQAPTGLDADFGFGVDVLEVGQDGANALLHTGDDRTIELPRPDYTAATELGETSLAAYRQGKNGNPFVDYVSDGVVTTTYRVRSAMRVSPEGTAAAFITTDDELVFLGATGETSFGTGFADVDLAAILGNGDCATEAGCHPFLEYNDFETEPYEINYEGPSTTPVPGAITINDAADGFLVTAQTSYSDTGSCGVLYNRQTQTELFQTCTSQVLDISPTSAFVIGTDPYGDGLGPRYFSILDATTGDEVARYEVEDAGLRRPDGVGRGAPRRRDGLRGRRLVDREPRRGDRTVRGPGRPGHRLRRGVAAVLPHRRQLSPTRAGRTTRGSAVPGAASRASYGPTCRRARPPPLRRLARSGVLGA